MSWGEAMVGLRVVEGATPDLRRSPGPRRGLGFFRYAVVGCLLLVGLASVFAAVLDPLPGLVATTFVTLVSEIVAAVASFWSVRRAAVGDRRWRVFIGLMATGLVAAGLGSIGIPLASGQSITSTSSVYAGLIFFY